MLALSSLDALLQYLAVYILVLLPLRAACFAWVAGSRFRVVYTGLELHRPETAVLRQRCFATVISLLLVQIEAVSAHQLMCANYGYHTNL